MHESYLQYHEVPHLVYGFFVKVPLDYISYSKLFAEQRVKIFNYLKKIDYTDVVEELYFHSFRYQ